MHGRLRVDHGPQLRDLWPAVERGVRGAVRGGAQPSRLGEDVANRGEAQGVHLLYRAHRHQGADTGWE